VIVRLTWLSYIGLIFAAFAAPPPQREPLQLAPPSAFETQPATQADPDLKHAQDLLDQGKIADAENAVRSYLMLHQRSADAHYLLGFVLFRKPDPRASLAEFTEAAKYRTPKASDLMIVGFDYVLLEDYADADKWFGRVLQWEPNNSSAWYYFGRTKYNENRSKEAIDAFERCLRLDPKNVKAEDNLGLCYQAMQRNDEATQCFKSAIAWQGDAPTNSGPFIDLGIALVDKNKLTEALPYLQKAVVISPDESRAHQELGKTYLKLNRLPDAQSELERAAKLAPKDAPLHFILGQVYRREGYAEKAKAEFAQYAELSGTHSTPDAATQNAQPAPQ